MRTEAVRFYSNFRIYIFPVVVALSSLILIIFVIYPQTVKFITNQKVQSDLEEKSKFLEGKALSLESLDETDLSRKVDLALLAFPTDRDFGNVLGILQTVASQNGFSITTLAIGSGSRDLESAQKYIVALESLGPEDLLPNFIKTIESQVRIMKVSNIEITVGTQDSIINAALGIEVFYSQAPESFGGADTPLPQLSSQDETILGRIAATSVPVAPQPTTTAFTPGGKTDPFE